MEEERPLLVTMYLKLPSVFFVTDLELVIGPAKGTWLPPLQLYL